MILKPSLMCLPLNDQDQCKTAPQGPGENMQDVSERNPAHPRPSGHLGCSVERGVAGRACISTAQSSSFIQRAGQEKQNP